MAKLGQINTLSIVKLTDMVAVFDAENLGEIELLKRFLPDKIKIGDTFDVFLYNDSEKICGTIQKPLAQVGQFAFLKVVSVNKFGAFLDWGLPKDLFVPFREQKSNMTEGRRYLVYIYIDEKTQRIAASAKIENYLEKANPVYSNNQEVDLIIFDETELGYKAIINHSHTGMLYKNEIFQPLKMGQNLKGYIKKIRTDHKIDLILNKSSYKLIDASSQMIIEKLKQSGGFLPFTDKTSPEIIYANLGISKKQFKMSIGGLYKNRIIAIEENGIKLL